MSAASVFGWNTVVATHEVNECVHVVLIESEVAPGAGKTGEIDAKDTGKTLKGAIHSSSPYTSINPTSPPPTTWRSRPIQN